MGLAANLLNGFLPKTRSLDSPTYRSLVRETASYAAGFDGYPVYRGNHEDPDDTGTAERAEIVFKKVVALEVERSAEIVKLLANEKVTVAATAEAWDGIGEWIARTIEGSREPGSDRYRPYVSQSGPLPPKSKNGESTSQWRPIFHSIALDLSLLYGRHMIEVRPGAGGHWGRHEPRSVKGEPEILFADYGWFHAPFSEVEAEINGALLKRLGLIERVPSQLGIGLRRVLNPPEVETADAAADLIAELRRRIADGQEISRGDMIELLHEHGLEELPKLPAEIAQHIPVP